VSNPKSNPNQSETLQAPRNPKHRGTLVPGFGIATRPAWPRVRKARRSSRLACGHWVNTGNLIVSRPGHGWTCLQCALDRIRERQPQESRP